MTTWITRYTEHNIEDIVGMLPGIFWDTDPRPAKEQIEDRYAHGGGYHEANGFTDFKEAGDCNATIRYPGDPVYREVARSFLPLTNELIILFDASFVAIVQQDSSYVVVRMD